MSEARRPRGADTDTRVIPLGEVPGVPAGHSTAEHGAIASDAGRKRCLDLEGQDAANRIAREADSASQAARLAVGNDEGGGPNPLASCGDDLDLAFEIRSAGDSRPLADVDPGGSGRFHEGQIELPSIDHADRYGRDRHLEPTDPRADLHAVDPALDRQESCRRDKGDGLGRQAAAAQLLARKACPVDEYDLGPVLREAASSRRPGKARPDDDHVVPAAHRGRV